MLIKPTAGADSDADHVGVTTFESSNGTLICQTTVDTTVAGARTGVENGGSCVPSTISNETGTTNFREAANHRA
jgi:hypothetical protein